MFVKVPSFYPDFHITDINHYWNSFWQILEAFVVILNTAGTPSNPSGSKIILLAAPYSGYFEFINLTLEQLVNVMSWSLNNKSTF